MTHLICYCFGFTREEMAEQLRQTGSSTIPQTIAERCKQGLQSCETKNPKGRCCLGDVRAVLKDLRADVEAPSCACDGEGGDV